MAEVVRIVTVETRGIGLPDYSAPGVISQAPEHLPASGADLTELAARLGSPNVFDRRGNIVWMDDFDSGVAHWEINHGTVEWTAEFFEYGGFSAKFSMLAPNFKSELNKRLWVPTLGNWGAEISFNIDYGADDIELRLTHYRPAVEGPSYRCELRYDAASDDLSIRTNTGWEEIVPDLHLHRGTRVTFHKMKIVADFLNGTYARYKFNGLAGSLTEFPMQQMTPTAAQSYLRIDIDIDAKAESYAYVDSLIITQNEPSEV